MHQKLFLYLGILCYTTAAAFLSATFDFSVLTTTITLVGLPLIYLWREVYPSRLFLISASALAIMGTVLFETIAHTSGIWYSVSALDFRVLGLFPVEILLANTLLFLYIIFLHEYLVDDKRFHRSVFNRKKVWLMLFTLGLVSAGVLFSILFSREIIPYAFLWLLIGIVATLSGAIIGAHAKPRHVLEKALHTSLLVLPILVIHEATLLFNVDLVFANPDQYLWSVEILGGLLPVEKLVYLVLIPIWIVSVYELYFDDAK